MTARLSRRLTLEGLENRTVLAANILASVVDGNLEIDYQKSGSENLDTEIRVVDNAGGGVTVTGLNGTQINGVANGSFASGAVNNILVDLEEGNDKITYRAANVTGDVDFNQSDEDSDAFTGEKDLSIVDSRFDTLIFDSYTTGSNKISISRSELGSVELEQQTANTAQSHELSIFQSSILDTLFADLGAGTNSVNAKKSAINDINYSGSGGNDTLEFFDSKIATDFGIDTGNGENTVAITRGDLLSGNITSGSGRDDVDIISTTVAQSLNINTGTLVDEITIGRSQIKDVGIVSGNGHDKVNINKTEVTNKLHIDTGNHNDQISIKGSVVTDLDDADFGSGNDLLTIVNTEVKRFSEVKLGDGEDWVEIKGSEFRGMRMTGDESDTANEDADTLLVANTDFRGSVFFNGDGGEDMVSIDRSSITGGLFVRDDLTGSPSTQGDFFRIVNSSVGGNTVVELGSGDDTILSYKTEHAGDLIVRGGGGADFIINYGSDFHGRARVFAGGGNDRIQSSGSIYGGHVTVQGQGGNDNVSADLNLFKGDVLVDGQAGTNHSNQSFEDSNVVFGTETFQGVLFTDVFTDYQSFANGVKNAIP